MQNNLISKIHSSPYQFAFAVAGGGSIFLSELLSTPGASRTVLEAAIPYATKALDLYLGKKPLHYCSLQTSLELAKTARRKALVLSSGAEGQSIAGFSISASLATTREKKGSCRFFMVCEGEKTSHLLSCFFSEDYKTRAEQEDFIALCSKSLLANACGLNEDLPSSSNKMSYQKIEAKEKWLYIKRGKLPFFQNENSKQGKLIFPGSFNSLHKGHLKMKEFAEKMLKEPLNFEVSLSNADKNSLTFYEISNVLNQFEGKYDYILTNAPTFAEKARLFPRTTFVIGYDTLVRIFDSKFYKTEEDMNNELRLFLEQKIRFLVFGRKTSDGFRTLKDFNLPEAYKANFIEVTEEDFRDDVSSTFLRGKNCYEDELEPSLFSSKF